MADRNFFWFLGFFKCRFCRFNFDGGEGDWFYTGKKSFNSAVSVTPLLIVAFLDGKILIGVLHKKSSWPGQVSDAKPTYKISGQLLLMDLCPVRCACMAVFCFGSASILAFVKHCAAVALNVPFEFRYNLKKKSDMHRMKERVLLFQLIKEGPSYFIGYNGSSSSNWNERPNAVAYGRLVVRLHLDPPTHVTLKFNRLF
ncbi:hypothetical protein ACSQ67_000132 [Phaseolus vulgaris]